MATDCDDTDPAIGATDVDNDGYIDCINDCDSSDPLALGEELCFDGVDNDCDVSTVTTAVVTLYVPNTTAMMAKTMTATV